MFGRAVREFVDRVVTKVIIYPGASGKPFFSIGEQKYSRQL